MRKYSASGVLPIIETRNNQQYIVSVKRTDDAENEPGSHSGFFGEADNDEERLHPEIIAQREFLEEFFVIPKDADKAFNFVFNEIAEQNKVKKPEEYTRNLIETWRKEKGLEIKEGIEIQSVEAEKESQQIDLIENGMLKVVYVLRFKLPLDINNIIMLDGEAGEDSIGLPKGLLDREIDVFSLGQFKRWWLEDKKSVLDAVISFKGGKREETKGFIDKGKISSMLALALNRWLGIL